MNRIEFLNKLTKSYQGSNDIIISDISDWLDRCQVQDNWLDDLYIEIKENYQYKTMPSLAEIKRFWQNIYLEPAPEYHLPIQEQREKTKEWNVFKLVNHQVEIRKKESHQMTMGEIDFCHQWQELYTEYFILKDNDTADKEIRFKLEDIKQKTIRGERMKFYDDDSGDRENKIQHIGDIV